MQSWNANPAHPHQGQPVLQAGAPLEQAQAAMLLLHGRGAAADDILALAAHLPQRGLAFLAPQAAGNSWYPSSFNSPLASNEPWLSSALQVIEEQLARLDQAGIGTKRTLLLGFSQGACLALEFAARNPQRYGGVISLSGALIGAPGEARPDVTSSLQGTPVFLGCSQLDPFIPAERVLYSAEILRRIGAAVIQRFYPGAEHRVNADEIKVITEMAGAVLLAQQG